MESLEITMQIYYGVCKRKDLENWLLFSKVMPIFDIPGIL